MDWENFRIFAAAARHATLTETARALRVSIATVARRLDALEAELDVRLVDRTARGIVVTAAGRKLIALAHGSEDMLAAVERLAASLRGGQSQERLRVSATEPVIGEILAPQLPRLLAVAPDIRLDLVVSNELVSLARRDADLAVRLAEPEGDSLIAKRLPSLTMGLYASKTFADQHRGKPWPDRLIGYDDTYGRIAEVRWMSEHGLDNRIVLRTSSTRAILNAAVAGVGAAILPQLLAERHSELVALVPPVPIAPRKIWLVWHRDLGRLASLKLARDWIVHSFSHAKAGASGRAAVLS